MKVSYSVAGFGGHNSIGQRFISPVLPSVSHICSVSVSFSYLQCLCQCIISLFLVSVSHISIVSISASYLQCKCQCLIYAVLVSVLASVSPMLVSVYFIPSVSVSSYNSNVSVSVSYLQC